MKYTYFLCIVYYYFGKSVYVYIYFWGRSAQTSLFIIKQTRFRNNHFLPYQWLLFAMLYWVSLSNINILLYYGNHSKTIVDSGNYSLNTTFVLRNSDFHTYCNSYINKFNSHLHKQLNFYFKYYIIYYFLNPY